MAIEVDGRIDAELGEGAIWDDLASELLTIDMVSGTVTHTSFEPLGSATRDQNVGDYVGAVLLAEDSGIVVVTRAGLDLVSPDGTIPLATILDDPTKRLNDAACDSQGRVWVGSTHVDVLPGAGELHVWSIDKPAHVAASDLTLPNGIGWSPEDDVIYVADSGQSSVLRGAFDPETGHVGPLTALFTVYDGVPDGLCVGADGSLWVAIWDGSRVEHRSPGGELLESIRLPVTRPTSCALVPGVGLAITTARYGLDAEALSEQGGSAGHLLIAHGKWAGLSAARVRTA